MSASSGIPGEDKASIEAEKDRELLGVYKMKALVADINDAFKSSKLTEALTALVALQQYVKQKLDTSVDAGIDKDQLGKVRAKLYSALKSDFAEVKMENPKMYDQLQDAASGIQEHFADYALADRENKTNLSTLQKQGKKFFQDVSTVAHGLSLFNVLAEMGRVPHTDTERYAIEIQRIQSTMKNHFSYDRFGIYVADVFRDKKMSSQNAEASLDLFEQNNLDNFFSADKAEWSFLGELIKEPNKKSSAKSVSSFFIPEGELAGSFQATRAALVGKPPQDAKEMQPLLDNLDNDLKKEWAAFWTQLRLKPDYQPAHEQRIMAIQDHLLFAYRSRAIAMMSRNFGPSYTAAKELQKLSLARFKQSVLERHSENATPKTPEEQQLKSAVEKLARNYTKRTHDKDIGELALMFDLKNIRQRTSIEKAHSKKFNPQLYKVFNHAEKINFLENILLNTLKSKKWGVSDKEVSEFKDDGLMFRGDSKDPVWLKIDKRLSEGGHQLFRELSTALNDAYKASPRLPKSENRAFFKAMVERVALEQRIAARSLAEDMSVLSRTGLGTTSIFRELDEKKSPGKTATESSIHRQADEKKSPGKTASESAVAAPVVKEDSLSLDEIDAVIDTRRRSRSVYEDASAPTPAPQPAERKKVPTRLQLGARRQQYEPPKKLFSIPEGRLPPEVVVAKSSKKKPR